MHKLLFLPVLLLSLFVGNTVFSADFQKGLDAYNKKDYATALREWKPLAKQEHALAQHNLGVMYAKGQGVPRNYKIAVTWYTLAAKQGSADAQGSLGAMYAFGRGGPKDYVEAYKWGSLAAANGNERAASLSDMISNMMTPTQVETAQDLARECVKKNYKGC